jgi:O-antigen biosynthesis protein
LTPALITKKPSITHHNWVCNNQYCRMEADLTPYVAVKYIPARQVLVLAPHPDDEVFGCGGAVAAHQELGVAVHVLVLTDGGQQGNATVREQESRRAGQLLGAQSLIFWHQKDRELTTSSALVKKLTALIQSLQIDLVYAPSPWEIHPDHRQAALLAAYSVLNVGGPCRLAFYEVGNPLRPNLLLDITGPRVDLKRQAMDCFASQQIYQDYSEKILALNRYRSYTLSSEVMYAEAFLLLQAAEVSTLLQSHILPAWGNAPTASAMQAPTALISVLIRSMDRPLFLQQALDSIAIQTWANIEVVLVAATDSHSPPPKHCGPHPLAFVTTASKLGRSAAANIALQHAKGEYLIFLDDDDWFHPDHISRLHAVLAKQPQVHAAYTGVVVTDVEGRPMRQVFDVAFDFAQQRAGNFLPIHSVLFRSSVLSHGVQFNESLDLYEDWDFWLQLAQITTFSHLPGVSASYRIHNSSGVHQENSVTQAAKKRIQSSWLDSLPVPLEDLMMRAAAYNVLEQKMLLAQETMKAEHEVRLNLLQTQMKTEAEARDAQLVERDAQLAERDGLIAEKNSEIKALLASRSWRVTTPLRWIGKTSGRIKNALMRIW